MPSVLVTMQQGDLRPSVQSVLRAGSQVIDLTGSTNFLEYTHRILGVKYSAPGVIVNATGGVARYDWKVGDTDIPGDYDLAWRSLDAGQRPITVPNDHFDRLRILRSIPYGMETFDLLYQLRHIMADDERELYPDDLVFVMSMHNVGAELTEALKTLGQSPPEFITSDVNNPLATDRALLPYEQDIWCLLSARDLVAPEILSAARRAAILRSQASHLDMTQVAKNIQAALQGIEEGIAARLDEALGLTRFLDVWVLENRFMSSSRPGVWPGWVTGPRTWPWSHYGDYA